MPNRLPHPCAQPGCPNLTLQRYCKVHEREVKGFYDKQRQSSTQRGYGAAWRRLRLAFLHENPWCCDPYGEHGRAGHQVKATDVDHILPKKRGGKDEWSNLESLCHPCHSRKTAISDGRFGQGGGG